MTSAGGDSCSAGASSSSPDNSHKRMPYRNSLGRQRELLESQINDRDHRIAQLEHELREARGSLVSSRRGLDEVQLHRLEHAQMQSISEARHKRQSRAAHQRIKVYKRDMDDMESLRGYAELIQEAAPSTTDSAYVLKLQKQIKKANERMDQQKEEMEVIRRSNEDVMESLMAEVCEVVEDRCRVEVDMANQIKHLRREMGEGEAKLREESAELERKLAKAQRRLRRFEQGDDGDDTDGQSNSEAADAGENKLENDEGKVKSNGTETIPEEIQEKGDDEEPSSPSDEMKLATLKGLQKQLKELQVESARTEEELHATLKTKRDEIANLKGG